VLGITACVSGVSVANDVMVCGLRLSVSRKSSFFRWLTMFPCVSRTTTRTRTRLKRTLKVGGVSWLDNSSEFYGGAAGTAGAFCARTHNAKSSAGSRKHVERIQWRATQFSIQRGMRILLPSHRPGRLRYHPYRTPLDSDCVDYTPRQILVSTRFGRAEGFDRPLILGNLVPKDVPLAIGKQHAKEDKTRGVPAVLDVGDFQPFPAQEQVSGSLVAFVSGVALDANWGSRGLRHKIRTCPGWPPARRSRPHRE